MINEGLFTTFQQTREQIKTALKWRAEGPVRDAVALALLPMQALSQSVDYEHLKSIAEILKVNHNKLSIMRSPVRYVLAAILLAENTDPLLLTQTLGEGRDMWRAQGLRRSAPYEGASLLMMALTGRREINTEALANLKSAYDYLKDRHYWHVGPFTLVTLSLALRFNPNAAMDGEQLFAELREQKFRGRNLMSAALLASLSPYAPGEKSRWMLDVQNTLRQTRLRSAARHVTGIALASHLGMMPDEQAGTIRMARTMFKEGPFSSSDAGLLAFNFTNMTRAIDMAQTREDYAETLTEAASIMSALQAFIAIQEQAAAMTAIIAGGAAAATAS